MTNFLKCGLVCENNPPVSLFSAMRSDKLQSWLCRSIAKDSDFSSQAGLGEEDIEDWTHEFLLDLRSVFEHFVSAFSELKKAGKEGELSLPQGFEGSPSAQKKLKGSLMLYDLHGKEGFMLFRNSCKLIFSYIRPGRIRIQFFRKKPFGEPEVFADSFLNAVAKDALSINWVHENCKGFVDINVLSRYYMKRFLQEA